MAEDATNYRSEAGLEPAFLVYGTDTRLEMIISMLKLLTKPGFCLNCKRTEVQLKIHHIPYRVQVAQHTPSFVKHMQSLGMTAYPIVMPDGHLDNRAFSGFNMKRLQPLFRK